eukprot:1159005-Pelagomonas_calceolata.AAC.9
MQQRTTAQALVQISSCYAVNPVATMVSKGCDLQLVGGWSLPAKFIVCDEQQHWKELTYLYTQYDEWDNAANTMMAHSPAAWEHVLFKDVSIKVSNVEVGWALQGVTQAHHGALSLRYSLDEPALSDVTLLDIVALPHHHITCPPT